MPGDTSRSVRGWPGVVHSTLGLLLAGFAFFHAAQNYPAVGAASAWVERALEHSLGSTVSLAIVLGALGLHAALGLRSYLRQRRSADSGLTFQLFTGALILGFVVYHVITLWPTSGASSSVREPYARLWHRLGEPLILTVYVVGISALAFHFGHGLLRLLGRGSFSGSRPLGRALGGVLGFVLLFVFVQIVARFALGEALIPALS